MNSFGTFSNLTRTASSFTGFSHATNQLYIPINLNLILPFIFSTSYLWNGFHKKTHLNQRQIRHNLWFVLNNTNNIFKPMNNAQIRGMQSSTYSIWLVRSEISKSLKTCVEDISFKFFFFCKNITMLCQNSSRKEAKQWSRKNLQTLHLINYKTPLP